MAENQTLKLSETNPYFTGEAIAFADGTSILIRDIESPETQNDDRFYLLNEGELTDSVADQLYQDSVADAFAYWWVIADTSPEVENPLDLSAIEGTQVRVPNIVRYKLDNQ